jgi:hypothetical protein
MVDPDISDLQLFKNLANKSNVDMSKPPPTSGVLETPKISKSRAKLSPSSKKRFKAHLQTTNDNKREPLSPPLVPTKPPTAPAIPPAIKEQSPKKPIEKKETEEKSKSKNEFDELENETDDKKETEESSEAAADDDDEDQNDDNDRAEESDDENDQSTKQEKRFYLLELERYRLQGVRLTQRYTMKDRLHDIRFEFDAHKANSESLDHIRFMSDSAKWVFIGIEWINSKVGPFLRLQGWSEHATRDMTRYNHCFQKLYQRYFRKMQMSPLVEFFWLVFGSAFFWHMQQSLLGSMLPTASAIPVPPSQNVQVNPPAQPQQQKQQPAPQKSTTPGFNPSPSPFARNVPRQPDLKKPQVPIVQSSVGPMVRQPSWLLNNNNNQQSNKMTVPPPQPSMPSATAGGAGIPKILEAPPVLSDSDSDSDMSSVLTDTPKPMRHRPLQLNEVPPPDQNDDNDLQEEDEADGNIDQMGAVFGDEDEGNFTDDEVE